MNLPIHGKTNLPASFFTTESSSVEKLEENASGMDYIEGKETDNPYFNEYSSGFNTRKLRISGEEGYILTQ